ncbi:hypothetical protein GCM10007140_05180 [Priestia taiwanensis]|uniref:Uncharacterized protein n=1 Tax=Priestia taiwanensis TaxID=1347902 RepID=A0A917AJI9_9BACI|nr:hypothetical protein GCM10007140_05180 [Priestia taiwanensis]
MFILLLVESLITSPPCRKDIPISIHIPIGLSHIFRLAVIYYGVGGGSGLGVCNGAGIVYFVVHYDYSLY